jgi:hypothetical protein
VSTSSVHPWRARAALVLFIVGLALPACIPVLYLLPLNAWWAGALTAGFALGIPELLWFVAALLIGKEGFRRLKRRMRTRWRVIVRRAWPTRARQRGARP